MAFLKPLLSVIILLAVASPAVPYSSIRMFPTRNGDPPIPADEFCESWKFSFEAGNAGNSTVPGRCFSFLQNYLYGKRYLQDSSVVAYYSYEFAKTVNISIISAAGKDAWIFDIDETLLSNLPYYEDLGYGSKTWDEIAYKEWVEKAEDRALPASMKLYKRLQKLGFKIILLTGRDESVRNSTQKNLLDVGYSDWVKLIMRGPHDKDKKAIVYKSEKRAELLQEGYILHENSGDQWSDVSGYALATRSFKLPNPVYFIY